jgi:hypothetical protein
MPLATYAIGGSSYELPIRYSDNLVIKSGFTSKSKRTSWSAHGEPERKTGGGDFFPGAF